eukprot:gnl/TRDRNA2_/TRDRNA2_197030_c0_seq1.p1 gnl/TRDRNA2_/TRDRNA2_197030_c0~~gnl/TRDRNA2_/TRDRNA2_197030_c0_seq1.p1  ORF type:complete len:746 (+),score=100.80 gnl/TRDRNA2_/TRDRNA2_197030_c0_seq1:1-2238(+)
MMRGAQAVGWRDLFVGARCDCPPTGLARASPTCSGVACLHLCGRASMMRGRPIFADVTNSMQADAAKAQVAGRIGGTRAVVAEGRAASAGAAGEAWHRSGGRAIRSGAKGSAAASTWARTGVIGSQRGDRAAAGGATVDRAEAMGREDAKSTAMGDGSAREVPCSSVSSTSVALQAAANRGRDVVAARAALERARSAGAGGAHGANANMMRSASKRLVEIEMADMEAELEHQLVGIRRLRGQARETQAIATQVRLQAIGASTSGGPSAAVNSRSSEEVVPTEMGSDVPTAAEPACQVPRSSAPTAAQGMVTRSREAATTMLRGGLQPSPEARTPVGTSGAGGGLRAAPVSNIATLFETRRETVGGSPEDVINAVLGDLVDGVLQSSHRQSKRHLPDADELLSRLGASQRDSILNWLIQACDIMRFHEAVLYSTVLTLDRYCAASEEPLPMERMQKVLMAVICTVLKTIAVSDEVQMPLHDLLLHLCRRQVPFEEILAMEHRVLQTLQFEVTVPSALDFLDALSAPLTEVGEPADSSPSWCLANFLLQLSLFNAQLHYRHPHAILAASSIYVALCSLQATPALVHALLQDVAAVCPEVPDVQSSIAACALDLHGLWLEFAATQGNRVPCWLRKFSNARLQTVALLNPPLVGALPHPAAFGTQLWQRSLTATHPMIQDMTIGVPPGLHADRWCGYCARSWAFPEQHQHVGTCPHCRTPLSTFEALRQQQLQQQAALVRQDGRHHQAV